MSKTEANKQKKLAKKRAKERQKQKTLIQQKQKLASNAGKLQVASQGPYRLCVWRDHGDAGLIQVFVARQIPKGRSQSRIGYSILGAREFGMAAVSFGTLSSTIRSRTNWNPTWIFGPSNLN